MPLSNYQTALQERFRQAAQEAASMNPADLEAKQRQQFNARQQYLNPTQDDLRREDYARKHDPFNTIHERMNRAKQAEFNESIASIDKYTQNARGRKAQDAAADIRSQRPLVDAQAEMAKYSGDAYRRNMPSGNTKISYRNPGTGARAKARFLA